MTTETQTTTEQALAKILKLCKNNGTTLDELLKLPVLDADGKIPAAVVRIVGALSDGHIIESGDNANGYYVRFADGTQVCWGRTAFAVSGASVTRTLVFPADFADTSYAASCFPEQCPNYPTYAGAHHPQSTTQMIWYFYATNGVMASMNVTFGWIVIGRWK